MGSGGNQAEPGSLKAAGKGVNIINPELDFDFTVGRHAASIKKKVSLVVRPKTLKMADTRFPKSGFW
jgi:hypothetical protein